MSIEEGFQTDAGKLLDQAELCAEELRIVWTLQKEVSFLTSYAESLGDDSVRPIAAQVDRLAEFFRAKRDWLEYAIDEIEHLSSEINIMLDNAPNDAIVKFSTLRIMDI